MVLGSLFNHCLFYSILPTMLICNLLWSVNLRLNILVSEEGTMEVKFRASLKDPSVKVPVKIDFKKIQEVL